jgi:hypothetical protein
LISVLQRELLITLRRGTPYGLLALNAALLAGLAAIVSALAGTISPWVAPTIGSTSSPTPTGIGPTLIAWRGPVLFFVLSAWLAILTSVVAPLGGARSVTIERSSGALDGLLGTGVSPVGLIIGKALGTGYQVALVLLSGLPAFALVWLFGGVGPRVVIGAVAVLCTYAAFLVVLGLLAGALLPGELPAAIVGGAIGGLLVLGTMIGFVVGATTGASGIASALALFSPIVGLFAANRELAEALLKAIPGAPAIQLRPTSQLFGATLGGPLPLIVAAFYTALTLSLLSLAAAAVDPYHPFKTLRLRQRQP